MMSNLMCASIVIGCLVAFLSDYVVVCEVDPSDMNSILFEQLRMQVKQLDLYRDVNANQLDLQRQQITLLTKMLNQQQSKTPSMEIAVSVSCTILGCITLYFIRRLIMYLRLRYHLSPEMPQTTELMDFALHAQHGTSSGLLRSVRVMKPPTEYLSCESSDE